MGDDDRLLRIDQILTRLAQAYSGANDDARSWRHIAELGHELFDQIVAQVGKGMPTETAFPLFMISELARCRTLKSSGALIAWETARIRHCLEAIWE